MTDIRITEFHSGRFGNGTRWAGTLLIVLGFIGLILPEAMSIGAELFIASLLVFGAVIWGYHSYLYSRRSLIDWLKPGLLMLVASLMIFYPAHGVAIVGLLLAVYLLMDSFGSFVLAQAIRPLPGWVWMLFNGIVSLILALLFLIGWPDTSMWLLGLYVSISLIFDGFALLFIGQTIRRLMDI